MLISAVVFVQDIKLFSSGIGAEDDVLWDTCKYIRRMEERLNDRPHSCRFKALIYEHGTHFVFPESMLRIMLPAPKKKK
jgi:hypothetical protein